MSIEIIENDIKVAQYYFYPTMKCSLNCEHCFIEEDMRNDDTQMTVEQFKTVVDKFADHFARSNVQNAEMTVMGGEPSLLPAGYYEEVIPYIREKFQFEHMQKYSFITLMTNFMHVGKLKKIDHLFDFVATSFEPARFVNDERKKDMWLKNLSEWMTEGRRVVLSFTTTADVTRTGTQLFDYFYDLGVRNFQINNAAPGGALLEHSMSNAEYQEHLESKNNQQLEIARKRKVISLNNNIHVGFEAESEFYRQAAEWLLEKSKTDKKIRVDPIHAMIGNLMDDDELVDIACGAAKGFSVRTDGVTTGCASDIGSSNPLSLGNMFTDDIRDIENCEIRQENLSANDRIHKTCLRCEFVHNCKGGCHQRLRLWDPTSGKECHGLKTFLTYLRDNEETYKHLRDY